ncbi:MAG: hypothetical protein JWP74_714 [Marmoricola sp.]|nr:hypothetical protein [Marmoricola sp.]
MPLSVEDCLAAITSHTRGLASAAEGNLGLRIEHCPDWSMADLVWHLTSVHWFWNQVASGPLLEEPSDLVRPERPDDEDLVEAMLTGARTMVEALRAADQQAPCWTWGQDQTVWFITRHQVQEAAVHHWDAVNASDRGSWSMDDAVAMDAVDEFLTHSVANPRWPMPDAAPMAGTLWFCACGGVGDRIEADSWHVTDGVAAGTLTHLTLHLEDQEPDVVGPAVGAHGDPPSFLLWLYRRVPEIGFDGDLGVLDRFRAFTFTD